MGLSATSSENPATTDTEADILAHCSIDQGGFKAPGRCGAVLRAYRKWKQLNA